MSAIARLAALAVLVAAATAPAQAVEKRVYLAPDDHTDLIWSADEAYYLPYFVRSLDFYLAQVDSTAGAPANEQARWNADGTLWLSAYEAAKTPAEFDRLMARVRDGHIGVPMNTIVSVHGATPVEGVIRDMYYAGRLERRYGFRFDWAGAQENQVQSFGLGSVLAGAGARYFSKGVCACGFVNRPGDRQYDAYWWVGADGRRVLAKWMSLHPPLPGTQDGNGNQGPGGYAETYLARAAVPFVLSDPGFRARWPYDVIGLVGQGWDYLDWLKDPEDFDFGLPRVARELSAPGTVKVLTSNVSDFFRDFEAAYGATLPTQSVSFGNDWEIGAAGVQGKTARLKRALERLRAAESLAAIAALNDPAFLAGRETERDTAFQAVGLFFEHNMYGFGNQTGPGEREAYQEDKAAKVEAYASRLSADAVARFGQLIAAAPGTQRFYAYNPLGWTRSDVADVAAPGVNPVHVVDLTTGKQVAAELLGSGADRRLRFLAGSVPSFGYKLFELRDGDGPTRFGAAATYSAGQLSNSSWRVTLNGRGAITSLIDRAGGNRELASGGALNDWGSGTGTATLERIGPVSATIRADIAGPVRRTVRVTLYRTVKRIDIENVAPDGFDGTQVFAFPLALPAPTVRHEEVGAVIRAKVTPAGDYTDRPQNANFEWLTLNHFAAVSENGTGRTITLSNDGASFFRLGNSSRETLDQESSALTILAGRNSDIPNQAGDRNLSYRFALGSAVAFSARDSMKLALEHQNPLVAGTVTGGGAAPLTATSWSFVRLSGSSVLGWALKPAEEGIARGLIVRAWNFGAAGSRFGATLGAPWRVTATTPVTHIETDEPARGLTLAPQQLGTFRLTVSR